MIAKKIAGTKKLIVSKPRRNALKSQDKMIGDVKLGRFISSGAFGDIFLLADDTSKIIKVPTGLVDLGDDLTISERYDMVLRGKLGLKDEAQLYKKYNLNKEPFFIPTQLITFRDTTFKKATYIAFIRPRITPITDKVIRVTDSTRSRVTRSMLESMRQKLITLSSKGFVFPSWLQIGYDTAGRLFIYDVENIEKRKTGSVIFTHNNKVWINFLLNSHIVDYRVPEDEIISKYGGITR